MAASAKPQKDLVSVKREPFTEAFQTPKAMTNADREILILAWDQCNFRSGADVIWFERTDEVMRVLQKYRLLPGEQT